MDYLLGLPLRQSAADGRRSRLSESRSFALLAQYLRRNAMQDALAAKVVANASPFAQFRASKRLVSICYAATIRPHAHDLGSRLSSREAAQLLRARGVLTSWTVGLRSNSESAVTTQITCQFCGISCF